MAVGDPVYGGAWRTYDWTTPTAEYPYTPSSGVKVEILLAGVWTDITGDVMTRDGTSNPITTTRGQQDWASQPQPKTCTFLLNNALGKYTPGNPLSPYYGQLGRNTQLRVSVPKSTGTAYRFWGEVSSWPVTWDTTGSHVWVQVTASGPLRRTQRSNQPVQSIWAHDTLAGTGLNIPVAYWTCEDGAQAGSVASAIGGPAMRVVGTPTFASYDDLLLSGPLPVMNDGTFAGTVPTYTTTGETQVSWVMMVPAGTTDKTTLMKIKCSGTGAEWWILYGTGGGLIVRVYDSSGTLIQDFGVNAVGLDGLPCAMSFQLKQNGANITWTVQLTEYLNNSTSALIATFGGTQNSRTVGRVTSISVNPNRNATGAVFGHITVLRNIVSTFPSFNSQLLYIKEIVSQRLQRICDNRGIDFTNLFIGSGDQMGRQHNQQSFSDLLDECTTLDTGILGEATDFFGLYFIPREALGSSAVPTLTLDYAANQLSGDVPVPVQDDQNTLNDATVTRLDGSTGRVTDDTSSMSTLDPPDGVGRYDQQYTINSYTDQRATDQAGWLVRLGTIDEFRYPNITVNLARAPFTGSAALRDAALAVQPGYAITLTNMPAGAAGWMPDATVRLLVLGLTETITQFEHTITFNTISATGYRTAIVAPASGDTPPDRVDTDGTTLTTAAASGDTVLYAGTQAGSAVWVDSVDSPADFPLDVLVGGERCTVSALRGAVRDTFDRSASSGFGTADSGQAWSVATGTAANFSCNGSMAVIALPTLNAQQTASLAKTSGWNNNDVNVLVIPSAVATGASLVGYVYGRFANSSNAYYVRVEFQAGGGIQVTLRKTVAGTSTVLDTYTTNYSTVANRAYGVRFQVVGSTVQAKFWDSAVDDEPWTWQLQATDTDLATGAGLALAATANTGNTNTSPNIKFNTLRDWQPQAFTVTRSVNGIVKAQAAGTDLALADPAFIAL